MDLDVFEAAQRTEQISKDNGIADSMAKSLRGRKAAISEWLRINRWLDLAPHVTRSGTRAKTTTGAIDAVTGSVNGGSSSVGRLHEITVAVMLSIALGSKYSVQIVRMAYDIAVVAPSGLVNKVEVKSAQIDDVFKATRVKFRQEQLAMGTRIVMALYNAHNPASMRYVVTDAETVRACLEATGTPITQTTSLIIREDDTCPVWDIIKHDVYTSPAQAIRRLKDTF